MEQRPAKTLLTLGHGYSADGLAQKLAPEGWHILGATRSTEKAQALRTQGIEPVMWDQPSLISALTRASHLLISAAPRDGRDPVLDLIGPAIAQRARALDWVGYLSTTGVYGDHQGGWVDETTPLKPALTRCQDRVQAERDWAAIPDLPLHIFRLAGIYGPGRGPFAKLRRGSARRIIKPGQIFSRIHRDDIAQVLAASIRRPNPGAIYNVCDNAPCPPQDVIAFAAQLLGLPLPPEEPFETAQMPPMARSFYSESRRVSNRRIRDELGVTLIHPDYRAGLTALLTHERE